jgi:hypothetical protein
MSKGIAIGIIVSVCGCATVADLDHEYLLDDTAAAGSAGSGGSGGGGGSNSASSQPSCDPGDPSLILCYRFEGSLNDESSIGNTAIFNDLAFDIGVDGQSVKLDDPASELWFNPSLLPLVNRAQLLASIGRFAVWITSGSNEIVCALRFTTEQQTNMSAGVAKANTWTHIACVREGTSWSSYVNGELTNTMSASAPTAKSDSVTGIGLSYPNSEHFEGLIDNLRVFNKPRSAKDICEAAGKSGC